jgi:hypothetical protein
VFDDDTVNEFLEADNAAAAALVDVVATAASSGCVVLSTMTLS